MGGAPPPRGIPRRRDILGGKAGVGQPEMFGGGGAGALRGAAGSGRGGRRPGGLEEEQGSRGGPGPPPSRKAITFFLRTWVRESPRRKGEVTSGPGAHRYPGTSPPPPVTTPTLTPTPPRRPHLDLPPGLAGGAWQHVGQVDAAHGTFREMANRALCAAAALQAPAGSRAGHVIPGAGQSGARAAVPEPITARLRDWREIWLQPAPSWEGPETRVPGSVLGEVGVAPLGRGLIGAPPTWYKKARGARVRV